MPTSLSKEHRRLLEKTTAGARVLAESACRAALENLAVHEREYRAHMSVEQRLLRNRLRARGRTLGDKRDERSGIQDIPHLTELAAYEYWHRLLFTRFLTENNLLIADEANGNVPVTLEECEELAPELGARDGLDLACRFASLTLPGVFRRNDPVLDLPIALNDQVELRKLLAALPSETFRADDALGWTYQFWQAQRKDEVNKSGKKIGADELSPVTQLFTEDYMVEFLLHNTLGAWWTGRKYELGSMNYEKEEEARRAVSLPPKDGIPGIDWKYLRFVKSTPDSHWAEPSSSFTLHPSSLPYSSLPSWLPAAGTFDGWPKSARLIRLLDPCMGSGHFLVFALPLFVRLRMEEEKLSAQAAVIAVLKENIHGLELDERCTQIAAFNVALTAWKLAGYQTLPSLNMACSGLAPIAGEAEWVAIAGENDRLRRGMKRLYGLFKDAPILGSLINPRALAGDLIEAEFHELAPLLTTALASSENQKAKLENDALEIAVIAHGLIKAAELLTSQFTLVITNVPFLGQSRQNEIMAEFCERAYPDGSTDLATSLHLRVLELAAAGSSVALVKPQNVLFLKTYTAFREALLKSTCWSLSAKLGTKAFRTPMWDFGVSLDITSKMPPKNSSLLRGIDVGRLKTPEEKSTNLSEGLLFSGVQFDQLKNPDSAITFLYGNIDPEERVGKVGFVRGGITSGDSLFFRKHFWEVDTRDKKWAFQQGTVETITDFGGRGLVLLWEDGNGELAARTGGGGATIAGRDAWNKRGVAITYMSGLKVTCYQGEIYENVICVLIPRNSEDLPALWAFTSSKSFEPAVRSVNQKLSVDVRYFEKAPFDLAHWQKVAAEKYPEGLPKPHSDDPTQWLFNGHPKGSDQLLHVAVARLLGYRWPRQTGSSFPDCPALDPDGLEIFADEDGIVCLPPLSREQPAAARLRQLLTTALGTFDERALIAAAGLKGSKSKTLEDWLRDEFFEQHAKIFHNRPFVWHLWDGRSDGFHALVNYHKLDHAMLQKLTYSYMGNWIQQQADDAKADKPGAAERLGAARDLQIRLVAILEGEAPLDIFVRWKPIKEQAHGWHPDLNDGIRQNIRPFLLAGDAGKKGAGLFRTVPLKLKDKDRGTEPTRPKSDYPWFWCEESPGADPAGGEDFVGNRWNNVHLTLARKKEASS